MVKFRVVVRFICLGIFLSTTFSITISWRSLLSLVAFLGKKENVIYLYSSFRKLIQSTYEFRIYTAILAYLTCIYISTLAFSFCYLRVTDTRSYNLFIHIINSSLYMCVYIKRGSLLIYTFYVNISSARAQTSQNSYTHIM